MKQEKTALIVVDVQNDFLPGGALAVRDGEKIIPIANRLMAGGGFDRIVATQDWHPASHGSFAANHAGKLPGELVQLGGLTQVLWPTHCVEKTSGADFAPGLAISKFDQVVRKGTDPAIDSYSGFFDNGHQRATGLDAYLKQYGVSDLYVLGLATDYCVKFTALDGAQLGYRVHLIEDACRGVNLQRGDVDLAIEQVLAAGVSVVRSEAIGRTEKFATQKK